MNYSTNQLELLLRAVCHIEQLVEVYFRPPDPNETALPKNIDVKWTCHELHIRKTTFFTVIKNRLIFPVDRIGNSDYYDREEVIRLYQRHLREQMPYRHMKPEEGLKRAA